MAKQFALNLDDAYQVMLLLEKFNIAHEQYTNTAAKAFLEVDLTSDVKPRIENASETIVKASNKIGDRVAEVRKSTMDILKDIEGFNEQDVMKKVEEITEGTKDVQVAQVKRVFK